MRVFWLPEALRDLGEIYAYLNERNPGTALLVHGTVRQHVEGLTLFPNRGRPGRWPGTRELVIPNLPFVVPYRVRGERVEVLRVFHASRQWPAEPA